MCDGYEWKKLSKYHHLAFKRLPSFHMDKRAKPEFDT